MPDNRDIDIADISLAIDLTDLRLLDCVFQANAPLAGKTLHQELLVTNPIYRFSFDSKHRTNVLQSTVSVRFALVEGGTGDNLGQENDNEVFRFGVTAGVVLTAPLMEGEAIAGRHLSGADNPAASRDKKMERSMRVEAIKAVYSLALSKMVELSSMSPLGPITLPLIDADEILDDITKREMDKHE